MKILLLIISFILFAQAQNWKLVWADDFNGNSLDGSKWTLSIGNNHGWGNNELEYYTDHNHHVANGELVITAKKENYDGF